MLFLLVQCLCCKYWSNSSKHHSQIRWSPYEVATPISWPVIKVPMMVYLLWRLNLQNFRNIECRGWDFDKNILWIEYLKIL